MKLDRRFTNGLAWAGVLLVIGVPAADLLSAQFSGETSQPAVGQVAVIAPAAPVPAPLSQRPDAPAAQPAAEVATVTPAKPAVPVATQPGQTAGVVDNFLQSGKPLPSYITGAGAAPAKPAQAAVTPAAIAPATAPTVATTTPPARTPIVTTPAAVDPVQVASIPKVAPVPMPLSMRPASRQIPVTVAAPITDIFIPPGTAPIPPAMVNSADLEDWESGPLSEFLAKKQGQRGSSATVTSDYDPNGFYLDEGPNPVRRDRVIGWEEPPFLFFAD